MGIFMPTLKAFGAKKDDAYDRLKMTIEAWLQGRDKAKSREWATLIKAVSDMGYKAAAENIPQHITN